MGATVFPRLLLAWPSNTPRRKSPIDKPHWLGMHSKCSFVIGDAKFHAPSIREILLTQNDLAPRMQHISPMDGIFRFMLWLNGSTSIRSGKHKQFSCPDLTQSLSLCFDSILLLGSISGFRTAVSSFNMIVGYWVGPDIEDGWGYAEASVSQVL